MVIRRQSIRRQTYAERKVLTAIRQSYAASAGQAEVTASSAAMLTLSEALRRSRADILRPEAPFLTVFEMSLIAALGDLQRTEKFRVGVAAVAGTCDQALADVAVMLRSTGHIVSRRAILRGKIIELQANTNRDAASVAGA